MIYSEGYHLWGMHSVWWIIWLVFLFWVYATPYPIPGARKLKDSPLDILQRRFAAGKLTSEEYEDAKLILKKDASL